MSRITKETLRSMGGREYIAQIKLRLRDDDAWAELVSEELVNRTRWGLTRLAESIAAQIERASKDAHTDRAWLRSITLLRDMVEDRLAELPDRVEHHQPLRTESSSREARAWRGFAAKLASVVAEVDPDALRGLQTPYGNLEVEDWLAAREAKQLSRRSS